jgi:peptidyl-prolyl cis-trans isomerase C
VTRIRQNILKRLIEKELVAQAVAAAGVTVPEADVEAAFSEYKKRFRTEEQFRNYLKHGKTAVATIKSRLRDKASLEKLIEARGALAVTKNEVTLFYKSNKRFYLEQAGVKASHILVKLEQKANKDQEKAAMDKIKIAQKRLKGGESFAAVAKELSEGPSKTRGGDLGFFGKGQMVKDFEKKAFSMKEGELSGPVRTRFGYHLIKVVAKRKERQQTLDEVREQIESSLKNKKFFQGRRVLLADLEAKATITSKLPSPKASP